MKVAIVEGPITPELFQRLESMGFEIVDMNDRNAMQGLRKRIEMDERFNNTDRMGIDDLKGTRIGIVGSFDHIGIGHATFASTPAVPFIIHAINAARQREDELEQQNRLAMQLRPYEIEPMPDIRIDKTKDRFSPFDKFAGRGKGPARSQKFSNHFKRK